MKLVYEPGPGETRIQPIYRRRNVCINIPASAPDLNVQHTPA
jgi:hypothetical protein